jgi:hypothetical protein
LEDLKFGNVIESRYYRVIQKDGLKEPVPVIGGMA